MEECNYLDCKSRIVKNSCKLKLTNEEDAFVDMPFCDYHAYIVIGGRFTAKKIIIPEIKPTKKEPIGMDRIIKFEIEGPFEEVQLIEQVMASREVTAIRKVIKK